MSAVLDKLLKFQEYDIYHNKNMDPIRLSELAEYFSKETTDLLQYFSYMKFSSKFCWANLILIIERMEYPQKLKGLPWLFELLQDVNWPVFKQVIQVIMSFNRNDVILCVEKYLRQAYLEDDGMWISGIQILAEAMSLEQSEFQDKEIIYLFQYGDLYCDE